MRLRDPTRQRLRNMLCAAIPSSTLEARAEARLEITEVPGMGIDPIEYPLIPSFSGKRLHGTFAYPASLKRMVEGVHLASSLWEPIK